MWGTRRAHCRSLGFPGFPVESCGLGQLHVVLFKENHISGRCQSGEVGNPGTLGMTKRRGLLKGRGPLPRRGQLLGRRGPPFPSTTAHFIDSNRSCAREKSHRLRAKPSNYSLPNSYPLLCHPERTRISYLTALTGATYVVLPKENHMQLTEAATLDRKSGRGICSFTFPATNFSSSSVGPAPE